MKRLHRPVQVFSQLDQMRDLRPCRLLLEQRQQGVDLVERSLTMRLAFGWIRGDHPLVIPSGPQFPRLSFEQ